MSDQPPPPPPPGPEGAAPDHRSAKADAKAAKAHAKAMRPWYKKKRWIGGIAILVLIIAMAAAGGSGGDEDNDTASEDSSDSGVNSEVDTNSENTDNPPQADVEVSECTTEEFVGPKAVLSVTNNSSGRSNYAIDVSFESEDGATQYGTGSAYLNNLEPGQNKTEEAVAFEDVPDGTAFKCRLVNVDRFAS